MVKADGLAWSQVVPILKKKINLSLGDSHQNVCFFPFQNVISVSLYMNTNYKHQKTLDKIFF